VKYCIIMCQILYYFVSNTVLLCVKYCIIMCQILYYYVSNTVLLCVKYCIIMYCPFNFLKRLFIKTSWPKRKAEERLIYYDSKFKSCNIKKNKHHESALPFLIINYRMFFKRLRKLKGQWAIMIKKKLNYTIWICYHKRHLRFSYSVRLTFILWIIGISFTGFSEYLTIITL
jgi:hypothetical protein